MRRLLAAASLALTACGFAQYRDISDDRLLNGQRYVSEAELRIHAVTTEPNYKKLVAYYDVTPQPGYDGPEVIFSKILPLGTAIEVIKVQECTNCFYRGDRVLVKLVAYIDRPVSIDKEFLREPYFSEVRR